MTKSPKKLTIQQLTELVRRQERAINVLTTTVKATDAAAALALYSLLQEGKVYTPDHWKTSDDIKNSKIPEAIQKMINIMSNMEDKNANRTDA